MFRKALYGIGAVTVLGLAVFGLDFWSYASTGASTLRESIHEQIPMDFELNHARKTIAKLVPEIRANKKVIAAEEVEVDHLRKDVNSLAEKLEVAQADIVRLRTDLKDQKASYVYAGRAYTIQQVRDDLARRFDRYRAAQATLESKQRLLDARTQSLNAARNKLINMQHAKVDLETKVEHLAAQLKTLEAAQASTEVEFDDSKLAQARKLVDTLQKRLETAQKLINAETGDTSGLIQLEPQSMREIETEIDEFFSAEERVSEPLAYVH